MEMVISVGDAIGQQKDLTTMDVSNHEDKAGALMAETLPPQNISSSKHHLIKTIWYHEG